MEVPTRSTLVARAQAFAEGRERPGSPAVATRGRWLAPRILAGLGEPDGGSVAIVIEAAKSAEVAPIIIEAYSPTPRERDVLGALARGTHVGDRRRAVPLTAHRAGLREDGVREGGCLEPRELVARLFGEHYADPLHATMVEVH